VVRVVVIIARPSGEDSPGDRAAKVGGEEGAMIASPLRPGGWRYSRQCLVRHPCRRPAQTPRAWPVSSGPAFGISTGCVRPGSALAPHASRSFVTFGRRGRRAKNARRGAVPRGLEGAHRSV